jgi:hypothetical protein
MADLMAHRVAAEPTVLLLESVEMVLVEYNEPFLREELAEYATTLIRDGLPDKAQFEVVKELLDVESRGKSVPLPEGSGSLLDVCLGEEPHLSGGEILRRR